MYPRLPVELIADSLQSAEHTLRTTDYSYELGSQIY